MYTRILTHIHKYTYTHVIYIHACTHAQRRQSGLKSGIVGLGFKFGGSWVLQEFNRRRHVTQDWRYHPCNCYLTDTNLFIYENSPIWKCFHLIFLYIGYNILWGPHDPHTKIWGSWPSHPQGFTHMDMRAYIRLWLLYRYIIYLQYMHYVNLNARIHMYKLYYT